MTAGKIRTLTSAGLLLVSIQISLAADQRQEFKTQWDAWGPRAEQEIAALPNAGRAALQKALIACSLFADDYLSTQYQRECEGAAKFFEVEFSSNDSFVKSGLQMAVTLTKVQQTQARLDAQQGRRGQDYDPQTWKVYIEVLQKAYHDANLGPSDVVAPSSGVGSSGAPILIPLQKEGGTYVVPVLINDAITLNFTVDSGASDVVIPFDVFATLVRAGTIQETDLLDTKTYTLGDGSTRSAQTFRLRSLTLGGKVIEDITGSVAPAEGLLLLGQSFLERFKSWSIDNAAHSLLLTPSPARNVPLAGSPAQASGTEPAAQTSSTPPQTQPTPPRHAIAWTIANLSLRRFPDPHADTVLPPPYDAIPQGSQITVLDDCKIWTASGRGAQDADNVWCPTMYGNSRGWANAYLMTANDGRRLACIKYPNANGCPR